MSGALNGASVCPGPGARRRRSVRCRQVMAGVDVPIVPTYGALARSPWNGNQLRSTGWAVRFACLAASEEDLACCENLNSPNSMPSTYLRNAR